MAIKTRRLDLNSIRINRTFLEKLGKLLEEETSPRESEALKKIEELKNKEEKQINSLKTYTQAEKQKNLQSTFKFIELINKPRHIVYYTINARGETLEYSSMKELLSLNAFPSNIFSATLRISHFDPKFVDVTLTFDNDPDKIALVLSSENEANMLKKEKEIRELCRDYKPLYAFIYKLPYFRPIGIWALAGLFSYFATSAIFDILSKVPIFKNTSIPQNWFILLIVLLFIAFIKSFNSLLPKYWFDLSNQNWMRTVAGSVFLAILAAASYDFVKTIL